MWIELNDAEQRLAKYIGMKRYQMNRATGVVDAQQSDLNAEQIDLNGAGAEIAYCKANNIFPPTATDRPTKKADGTTHFGVQVDVKHSVNGRNLNVVRWAKAGDVDLYALVEGDFPKYRIVGHMLSSDMLKEERLKPGHSGMYYSAAREELT